MSQCTSFLCLKLPLFHIGLLQILFRSQKRLVVLDDYGVMFGKESRVCIQGVLNSNGVDEH